MEFIGACRDRFPLILRIRFVCDGMDYLPQCQDLGGTARQYHPVSDPGSDLLTPVHIEIDQIASHTSINRKRWRRSRTSFRNRANVASGYGVSINMQIHVRVEFVHPMAREIKWARCDGWGPEMHKFRVL